MFSYVWLFISYYLRPIYKWFLRKTTGLCELQRICYGEIHGAPRIKGVERSLNLSRRPEVKRLVCHLNDVGDNGRFTGENEREILQGAISTILLVKKINPKIHYQFVKSFGKCVEQIWGYRQLYAEVESRRKTNFDSDNEEHEAKLYDLWEKLMPDVPLTSRISKQWQDIGFQGDDPKTDFRGMGLLGLENLQFFATEYKGAAAHVLSHSRHPQYGYTYAIVGINLTSMAYQFLKNGDAKVYMYNTSKSLPSIRLFHQFYCYLFYEFDKFWIDCKPSNIMEFSAIKERFESSMKLHLQDPSNVFRINISVDTI